MIISRHYVSHLPVEQLQQDSIHRGGCQDQKEHDSDDQAGRVKRASEELGCHDRDLV